MERWARLGAGSRPSSTSKTRASSAPTSCTRPDGADDHDDGQSVLESARCGAAWRQGHRNRRVLDARVPGEEVRGAPKGKRGEPDHLRGRGARMFRGRPADRRAFSGSSGRSIQPQFWPSRMPGDAGPFQSPQPSNRDLFEIRRPRRTATAPLPSGPTRTPGPLGVREHLHQALEGLVATRNAMGAIFLANSEQVAGGAEAHREVRCSPRGWR